MFEDTHPHLFNIAGTKDSGRDNTLGVLSRAKRPRLYRAPLSKHHSSQAVEVVRRFRCTVSCEVLRSGDENDHGLRESSGNQIRVWKSTGVDRQIEAVFDDR